MCGIAGWQFAPTFEPSTEYKSILTAFLAYAMDSRGGDSYGICKLNRRGEPRIWKGLGPALGSMKLGPLVDTQQLMLHTRKRTHGAVSIENAHPLSHGHIIGCHNGIVNNHEDLNDKYNRSFDLDSRHIFQHLAEGRDVGEIGVYGAISFIDSNTPQRLNLCKVSISGDLEVVGLPVGSKTEPDNTRGIIYCSTKGPIEAAMKALHETYFFFTIPEKKRFFATDGILKIDGQNPLLFSNDIYRKPAKAYTSYRSEMFRGFPYKSLAGFTPCKECKKAIKKAVNKKLDFYESELCTKNGCWLRYTRIRKDNLVDKAKDSDRKCPRCGAQGVVRKNYNEDIWYCTPCYIKLRNGDKESSASASSNPLPPGPLRISPRTSYSQLPLELEQWDLCVWCADAVRSNKKWDTTAFCPSCSAKWEAMIQDLRTMSKEERELFAQVVICSKCRLVPTFGWTRKDAFVSDTMLSMVMCTSCSGRCATCGTNDSKKLFASRKDKTMIPYCADCFRNRKFSHRDVDQPGYERSMIC